MNVTAVFEVAASLPREEQDMLIDNLVSNPPDNLRNALEERISRNTACVVAKGAVLHIITGTPGEKIQALIEFEVLMNMLDARNKRQEETIKGLIASNEELQRQLKSLEGELDSLSKDVR